MNNEIENRNALDIYGRQKTEKMKKSSNAPKEFSVYGTTPSGKPRLFVCHTCTRAFARLEHLRRHERSHTQEKPFSCGVCQRKFSRRDLLLRHAQKLHSGCADAITRLRRRSSRRSDSVESDRDDFFAHQEDETVRNGQEVKESEALRSNTITGDRNKDAGNLLGYGEETLKSMPRFNSEGRFPSQQSESLLRNRLLGKSKTGRSRVASFSAQSGANYAIGLPGFKENYPGAGNVEFSTPQLLPSTVTYENNLLNELDNIPMGDNRDLYGPLNSIGSFSLDSPNIEENSPRHMLREPTFAEGFTKNDSPNLYTAKSHYDYDTIKGLHGISSPSLVDPKEDQSSPLSKSNNGIHLKDDLISDVKADDERLLSAKTGTNFNVDDFYSFLQKETSSPLNEIMADHRFTLEFDDRFHSLNNLENFVDGLNGSEKQIKEAAIFTSPKTFNRLENHTIYDQQMYGVGHPEVGNLDNKLSESLNQILENATNTNEISSFALANFSKNKLFTSHMRTLINKSLSRYPIEGVTSPCIPSNERLEHYTQIFIQRFLPSLPFIHNSKLNEHLIMSATSDEDPSNESARICLPLLVATIGALFAQNRNDSEHLYEASRRVIHIYLENRKITVNDAPLQTSSLGNNTSLSMYPIWLIQSLTLSILYGLSSENESNVFLVIRQLKALNSLVKSSIKNASHFYFSVGTEEQEDSVKMKNILSKNLSNQSLFLTSRNADREILFRHSLNFQLQIRLIFVLYRLNIVLHLFYNTPSTLSLNDISPLEVFNQTDEFIWGFKNFQSFQEFDRDHENVSIEKYLLDLCERPRFGPLIQQIADMGINSQLRSKVSYNILKDKSNWGMITILYGIYDLKYHGNLNNAIVYDVLEFLGQWKSYYDYTLCGDLKSSSIALSQANGKATSDIQGVHFHIIKNLIKIDSIYDQQGLKEQSWLRNFDATSASYSRSLKSLETFPPDFKQLSSLLDSCSSSIVLLIFSVDPSSDKEVYYSLLSDVNVKTEAVDGVHSSQELNLTSNILYSVLIFEVFSVLSMVAVCLSKAPRHLIPYSEDMNHLLQKFSRVLNILGKIEALMKQKFIETKVENEFTNLNLYSCKNNRTGNPPNDVENTLYILKIGELLLKYLYDTTINAGIFRNLSENLGQMREELIRLSA